MSGEHKFNIVPLLVGTLILIAIESGQKRTLASPPGPYLDSPTFSPDGKNVAFVQLPPEGKLGKDFKGSNLIAGDWDSGNAGNIAVIPFGAANIGDVPSFGAAKVLVQSTPAPVGEYHFYPSWSPDNNWILFVSAGGNGRYPGSSKSAPPNIWGAVNTPYPKDALLT